MRTTPGSAGPSSPFIDGGGRREDELAYSGARARFDDPECARNVGLVGLMSVVTSRDSCPATASMPWSASESRRSG